MSGSDWSTSAASASAAPRRGPSPRPENDGNGENLESGEPQVAAPRPCCLLPGVVLSCGLSHQCPVPKKKFKKKYDNLFLKNHEPRRMRTLLTGLAGPRAAKKQAPPLFYFHCCSIFNELFILPIHLFVILPSRDRCACVPGRLDGPHCRFHCLSRRVILDYFFVFSSAP